MKKRNKIIYWVATGWLALGMLSGGLAQLFKAEQNVEGIIQLGYPIYFMTLLGIWKILGVIAILIPKFKLVKEWAYAGFFFAMTGAFFSQLAAGNGLKELFGPTLLLMLIVVSWYFRPADRKIILDKN